ncbi:tetratricopeptide repeat protein [Acinetobacter guillouiae]|uniref:tetratricopeptide repeat protein n=1 Tax=Acinetobacter guillouiae TaxID=106649 RepID=UPI0028E3DAF4|nr:tetratricopeptide repeat protein [Acinetobacter guillouiae]
MRLYVILFFLMWSNILYAKCIKVDDLNEKKIIIISLYSLQGNQNKIDEDIQKMKGGYYVDYYYGYSYLIGKDRLKNYELAEFYLNKSANYCFSPAHYSLGYLYYLQGDLISAKKWFISAKELGDNLAAHLLGTIYKNEKETEKMMENLLFAESNGFTPSITELGVIYYDGTLVEKDLQKAFDYFERAAKKNDPLAQNNLGWMYEHGEGTEINIEKAEYWYRIAFENGFELAAKNLNKLNNTSENKILF